MMADIVERTLRRLDELIEMGQAGARYDQRTFRRWLTSTRNLMLNFVGPKTVHYESFDAVYSPMQTAMQFGGLSVYDEGDHIRQIVGVLEAARDDIAAGLMLSQDLVISAANFGDILDQAGHLLENHYKDAAAVLIGAVLESSLRKLCDKQGLTYTAKETMEPLNVKLAKSGVYAPLTQKMVTTWGDLRNNAAHGHFDRYAEADVRRMHQWVTGFLEQRLR